MGRRYVLLDVFTDTPLTGNPLAVVLDSDGLNDARMLQIAREFNLSETVFVLPATNPVHSAKLRIFTPAQELPFAGHPTVGSAVLLARQSMGDVDQFEKVMVLEEGVGPVRCGVWGRGRTQGHAIFDLPRLPEEMAAPQDRGAIAGALGLVANEIGFENHRLSAWSAGMPVAFVPVRNLAAMSKVVPQAALWSSAFGPPVPDVAFLYTRETSGLGRQFHARMFAPGLGLTEDPATGAAAAAFAGVVQTFDTPPSGSRRIIIEQGFEMGRPSLITLETDSEGGKLVAARVGGDAVIVAEGMLEV
jgi:trans-2,3-dihydro-3-hydroxyanthranilate isomerase